MAVQKRVEPVWLRCPAETTRSREKVQYAALAKPKPKAVRKSGAERARGRAPTK